MTTTYHDPILEQVVTALEETPHENLDFDTACDLGVALCQCSEGPGDRSGRRDSRSAWIWAAERCRMRVCQGTSEFHTELHHQLYPGLFTVPLLAARAGFREPWRYRADLGFGGRRSGRTTRILLQAFAAREAGANRVIVVSPNKVGASWARSQAETIARRLGILPVEVLTVSEAGRKLWGAGPEVQYFHDHTVTFSDALKLLYHPERIENLRYRNNPFFDDRNNPFLDGLSSYKRRIENLTTVGNLSAHNTVS